ncbi:uncharacterized protein DNG_03826 [Cephalotrichum gorgonifer]|uniref:Uncharacterized protein n=1 Tax=Cephalotrichum gorgonifer TaxID=2041049 RepID=A0AAE8SUC3_9PEZI|nr:uncharacterized protein DNG_03826 [Cephalotrichum gorgonifer]
MSQAAYTNLLDQHNRLIAEVLTRFRALCHFATSQADVEGKDPDPAAMGVSRLSMQLEFEGLNTALKDLLALSRRIKELWVFGPLASHEAANRQVAGDLERDVLQVAALANSLEAGAMNSLATQNGGVWREKPKEGPPGRG